MAAPATSGAKPANINTQFYQQFQKQVNDIEKQFAQLEQETDDERAATIDRSLAGIAQLSNDVNEASSYLPAYDQRNYGDTVKTLSIRLQDLRASFAPTPKFSFKKKPPAFTAHKNESALSVDALPESHPATPARHSEDDTAAGSDEPAPPAPQPESLPQNHSRVAVFTGHEGKHIIFPVSTDPGTSASATISSITSSVVDMRAGGKSSKQSLATLTLKDIRASLIVCAPINGAVHLTNIADSVIVISSRQFRMHESKNCDIYLRTSSRPIIEDCSGIRFAPLPETYAVADGEVAGGNQWDQVDDFKWLRSEPSPNWRVMGGGERLEERVWAEAVPGKPPGKPCLGVEDILREVGLGDGK